MRHVFIYLCLTALLLPGCANYRLGPPGELPFRTVYVVPVRNQSFAPQASAQLTDDVITNLQDHGNIKTLEGKEADVSLNIVINDYQRTVGATQQNDTALAQSYLLSMTAEISIVNNRTGDIIMKPRAVSAEQQAFVDGGFQVAEYQALPVLTRELANNIADEVVSVW